MGPLRWAAAMRGSTNLVQPATIPVMAFTYSGETIMLSNLLNSNNLKSIEPSAAINSREMLLDAAKMLNKLSFAAGSANNAPDSLLDKADSISSELLIAAGHFDVLSKEAATRGD